jgi:hypothetical protein
MRIAIAMRSFESGAPTEEPPPSSQSGEPGCFAEFEVAEGSKPEAEADDETVQVTVVLRGRRGELENPALGMTELVLRALRNQGGERRSAEVIDVTGIAVEPAYAG